MSDYILTHEATLRSGVFFGLLLVFFALENWRPRRVQNVTRQHFLGNFGLGVFNGFLLRLLMPGGLVALAALSADSSLIGWLKSDLNIAMPFWAEIALCLVLLDLTLYWQHRLFHRIPLLWALHGAHHGDRNLNVSSGLRFHPGEAVVSFAIKGLTVLLLGPPVIAVILFEILLNGASLFNHANWSLGRADRWLRYMIVTPDMHRLHHSRQAHESLKNFGFFLSIWDRLFASYQDEPAQAHKNIALGLDEVEDDGWRATLRYPFKSLRRK